MKAETNAHNAHDSGPNFKSSICQKYFQCMFIYQAEISIIIFHDIHDVFAYFCVGWGRGIVGTVNYKSPPPLPTSKKTAFFIVLSICTVEYGLCGEHWLSG